MAEFHRCSNCGLASWRASVFLVVLLSLTLVACSYFDDVPIVEISLESGVPFPGMPLSFKAKVIDHDSPRITYKWLVDGKVEASRSDSLVYEPTIDGMHLVLCQARDSYHSATDSYDLAVPSPGTPSYEKSRKLIGWLSLAFAVDTNFGFNYHFYGLKDFTGLGDDWNAIGTREDGGAVVGGYRPSSSDWSIYDPSNSEIDILYVFKFDDEAHMSGYAYIIPDASPELMSMGFFLVGQKVTDSKGRASVPSGSPPSLQLLKQSLVQTPDSVLERYKKLKALAAAMTAWE
ncbi:MAG: hypothetical protein WCQ50_01225 [Spirochaetota bacterium]